MTPAPGSFLPLSNDVVFILMAVAERPLHGYAIIQEVERRSSASVRLQTGALYRALKRLLDDGLILECDAPKDEPSQDERRRYYKVSRLGERVLAAEVERMSWVIRAARSVQGRPRLA